MLINYNFNYSTALLQKLNSFECAISCFLAVVYISVTKKSLLSDSLHWNCFGIWPVSWHTITTSNPTSEDTKDHPSNSRGPTSPHLWWSQLPRGAQERRKKRTKSEKREERKVSMGWRGHRGLPYTFLFCLLMIYSCTFAVLNVTLTLIHSNLSSWGWWREPAPRDLTQAISSDLPPSISPFCHTHTHTRPWMAPLGH